MAHTAIPAVHLLATPISRRCQEKRSARSKKTVLSIGALVVVERSTRSANGRRVVV
jgi:hypothetical protein